MKHIAIAPNAFRGSLSALQAAACIAEGLSLSRLSMSPTLLPLADGGDGTLEVIRRGLGGESVTITVQGADGNRIPASLGLMSDGVTAVIEMAQASGIERLAPDRRNPLLTTTYGTGELIKAAVERGFKRLLIGLGGSATNDGGAGCLQTLGARLLDSDGQPIPPGGEGLLRLAQVDFRPVSAWLAQYDVELLALCDVENPLIGEMGASRIFAPQKGATPAMVETLEQALTHFAAVVKTQIGRDITTIAGGGAAGGIGAGLVVGAGARIVPGAETVIDLLGYEEAIAESNLVITGEGRLDSQTAAGKAVRAVAGRALRNHVPVIALVGGLAVSATELGEIGLDSAWSIIPTPCTLAEAIANTPNWLTDCATRLGNTLAIRG
jgi:glycerate kinase